MLMIWSLRQSLNLITPLSCTSVKLISKSLLIKGLNQSYFISRWNMIVPVSVVQGPVVRRPIRANPELNFNPGLFFFIKSIFSDNFLYSF